MKKSSMAATTFRKNLFKVLDDLQNPTSSSCFITKEGEIAAVVHSALDWEAWQETLDIVTDATLLAGIEKGLADLKKRDVYMFEEVFGGIPAKRKRR